MSLTECVRFARPNPKPQRMLEEVLPRIGKIVVATPHVSVGRLDGGWMKGVR